MKCINPNNLNPESVTRLKKEFQAAQPYKHIVVDNFLKEEVAEFLFQNFPPPGQLNKHYKGLNENKSEGSNFESFHNQFSDVREDIISPEFCKWVSEVTGIDQLFVTPDNLGAGLHQGKNGSFLDVHIDFNIHPKLNVHRRLNLLIYMNKGWKQEWGGELEMWNADMSKCVKKVLPVLNRCVIFETNEISYHGYSKISVPEGTTRRSFYAYFYTNEREGATTYHDTFFKAKPEDTAAKKLKTSLKENLKNFTKRQLKKVGVNI